MAIFDYVGLNENGQKVRGTIDASSRSTALARLRESGVTPLYCDAANEAKTVEQYLGRFRKVKMATVVVFTRQLSAMLDAQLPILQAIEILSSQPGDPRFRNAITQLGADLQTGLPLHEALTRHPKFFNNVYVAMVRSGEEAGDLPRALRELAVQLEQELKLKRLVKSASTYPKVVLIGAFVILSGLMIFIVPKFAQLYEETVKGVGTSPSDPTAPPPDASLPKPTQIALEISRLLYPEGDKNSGWMLQVGLRFVAALAILVVLRRFVALMLTKPVVRKQWDQAKLRLPFGIGTLIQKVAIARFSRTFSSLLEAGIPAVDAMEIVARTAGNILITQAILKARDQMLAGSSISGPISRSAVFPPMVSHMIQVGEESGSLQGMLSKIAEFYEEEVEATLKSLTSVIEPLLIMIVGAVIGVAVIITYLPMFKLYDLIQV